MDTLNKMKEILEEAMKDGEKCMQKGTITAGRRARKQLSELSKLCKQARQEILDKMNEGKDK